MPQSDWVIKTKLFGLTKTAFTRLAFAFVISLFALGSLLVVNTVKTATPPTIISYQGKLLESGVSVTTTKSMAFLLYTASSGGSLLYTAGGTLATTSTVSVTPSQGIFSVDLGSGITNSIDSTIFKNNATIYLEVWVDGTALSPRKQITASPFAMNSKYLMGYELATASSSVYIPLSDSNGNLTFSGDPQSSGVSGGLVYINPASADANETLFGIALNGTEKFRVDEDGDGFLSASMTIGTSTNSNAYLKIISNNDANLIVQGEAGGGATFKIQNGSNNVGFQILQMDDFTVGQIGTSGQGGTFAVLDNSGVTTVNLSGPSSSYINQDLYIGSINTEAITTSTFTLDGNDMYVADLLGVGGSMYIENDLHMGGEITGVSRMIGSGPRIVIGTGTPTHQLTGAENDDLFLSDMLEVDGTAFFDGRTYFNDSVDIDGVLKIYDDRRIVFGGLNEAVFLYSTLQTTDSLLIGVSSASNSILFTENADYTTDFGHTQQTNPTVYIHSADATDTSQWLSLTHDQTDGIISTGSGDLNLTPATGFVGINTTTPAYNLTVSGTTYISDTLTMGGNILMAGNDITGADQIIGNSNNIIIGDAGTDSHDLTTNDDLFISGMLEVDGYSFFDSSASFTAGVTLGGAISLAGNDITGVDQIIGNSTVITIGDAGTTSRGLTANDDLYVSGKLEVDGTSYFDGSASFALGVNMGSNADILTGVEYGVLRMRNTAQTIDSAMFAMGTGSNYLIFNEYNDRNYNFAHTQQTNPTVFIHSANQSATEYISLTHNQTDGVIQTGAGNLTIGSGSDNHTLNTPNDLFVSGMFEVDGVGYFDGNIITASTIYMGANKDIRASSGYGSIMPGNTSQTLASVSLHTGTTANSILITELGDTAYNFAHTLQTNPTVFIHSANQSATEYISLTHNQTDGVIQTGAGNLTIGSGSDSHTLTTPNDLFVSGKLEVDGNAYFDTNSFYAAALTYNDNVNNFYGSGTDVNMRYDTAQTTNAFLIGLSTESLNWLITSKAESGKQHGRGISPDPTLFIFSGGDVDADDTQFLKLTHDQTNGVIGTGSGDLNLMSATGFVGINTTTVNYNLAVDGSAYITRTLNIGNELTLNGESKLIDGDAEKSGISDWLSSATLTKDTTSPHSGSQAMRLTYLSTANPIAYPLVNILIVGQEYRITGWARGDGTVYPYVKDAASATLWQGTVSTEWQYFDVTWTAANGVLYLRMIGSSGWVEFDDVSVFKIESEVASINTGYGDLNLRPATGFVGINTTTASYGLTVSGTTYISGASTFAGQTLTQGNVLNPTLVSTYQPGGVSGDLDGAARMRVFGDYAYIMSATKDQLVITNIADPASPTTTAIFQPGGSNGDLDNASGIDIKNNYAYALSYDKDQLVIIDITNPASPTTTAIFQPGGLNGDLNGARMIKIVGKYAYIASLLGGKMVIVDISDPYNPSLVSTFNAGGTLANMFGLDVVGNYAYLTTSVNDKMVIVDISDPYNPSLVSTYQPGGVGGDLDGVRNLKVVGNYAYITAFSANTIVVVDISNPESPTTISIFQPGTADLYSPEYIEISGNYAYVSAYTNAALKIIDITDKSNLSIVSSVNTSLPGEMALKGNYIYQLVSGVDSLYIIDITGAVISNTEIGTAQIDNLQVFNTSYFGNGVDIKGGLSVGRSGLLLNGNFGMSNGTNSSTLTFASSTLFTSNLADASASDTAFTFNTNSFGTSNLFKITEAGSDVVTINSAGRMSFFDTSGNSVMQFSPNSSNANINIGGNGKYGGLGLADEAGNGIIYFAATTSVNSYISSNFLVGAAGESIADANFVMNGQDFYVHDKLGVNGDSYFDGTLNIAGVNQSSPMISLTQTPTFGNTNTILDITAAGTNWDPGGRAITITALTDTTVTPLAINTAGQVGVAFLYNSGTKGSVGLDADSFNIITYGAYDINLIPDTTGITVIGDAGTTSRGLTANDDLFVSGQLEVGGYSWFDAEAVFSASAGANALSVRSANATSYLAFAPYTDDGVHMGIRGIDGTSNNNLILTTLDNNSKDHDHDTLSANPTLFIQSNTDPDTDNTQWLSLTHDQTNGVITTGKGYLTLDSALGGISFLDPIVMNFRNILLGSSLASSGFYSPNATGLYRSMNIFSGAEDYGVSVVANANKANDYSVATTTNPHFRVYSATAAATSKTQYIEMYHDQTNGVIGTGQGALNITSASSTVQINGTQVLYLPSTMTGSMIVGDGGANLSHTTGNEGYYNTFVGIGSGSANTTGNANTANGHNSLYSNTTGYENIAIGVNAMYNGISAYQNTAIGLAALYTNTTGSGNTAIGRASLYSNTASNNTALGWHSGRFIAGGLTSNVLSNTSLYLGAGTKAFADGDTNEIVIGYNATGNGSNTVTLGNDNITKTVLRGAITFTSSTIPDAAHIFDTDTAFTSASDYLFSVRTGGTAKFSVEGDGTVRAAGQLFASSATVGTPGAPGDLAERVDINPAIMAEAGDVLVVDASASDMYTKSSSAYTQEVAGVVSTNPTITVGNGKTQHTAVMAMVGRVPIKVSAENGPIERGDLLITASAPGHAMRYDPTKDTGDNVVGIVGIALDSLDSSTGKIMGLIKTGWVNNKNQTIAQIQQDLISVAQDNAINLQTDPNQLTVVPSGSSILPISSDLNMNNFSIVNVRSLIAINNVWSVDVEGRFITKISTTEGDKNLYALQSQDTELIYSGSGTLVNGEFKVLFSNVESEIIDADKPIKVSVTLTAEANGIFVSQKDITGFTVKELQSGTSNATFDWVVIASRRIGPAPVVVEPVPEIATSTPTTTTEIVETPTTTVPVVDTSTTTTPIVEDLVVLEPPPEPVVEPIIEPTPEPLIVEPIPEPVVVVEPAQVLEPVVEPAVVDTVPAI